MREKTNKQHAVAIKPQLIRTYRLHMYTSRARPNRPLVYTRSQGGHVGTFSSSLKTTYALTDNVKDEVREQPDQAGQPQDS